MIFSRDEKLAVHVMKFEIPFVTALVFLSADLMARVAVQGVEQALLTTVIEWSINPIKRNWKKFFPHLQSPSID